MARSLWPTYSGRSRRSTPSPTIAAWCDDGGHIAHRARSDVGVAQVALDPLRRGIEVAGTLAVRGGQERVDRADLVSGRQQRVDDVRADEPGAAGHEDHRLDCNPLVASEAYEGGMPDVVLPVLDERDALPWVLERMPAGYAPIVVDNGSSDGSAALAARLGAQRRVRAAGAASAPRAGRA